MYLQFHGAVQITTGSKHVLGIEDRKILLDCGLFQGRRAETYEKNLNFPFSPREITAALLSHAHIDHCGNLPNLVKQGFEGDIFCTPASFDLARALLRDSGHIQEKDAQYVNKKRARKGQDPVDPIYTAEDAERCLYHFEGRHYHKPFHILENAVVSFLDAGHILGSALTLIDVDNGAAEPHRVLFTGDLGRKDMPILKDPEIPDGVHTMIIESTYGKRLHGAIEDSEKKLEDIVNRVAERKGRIIIPSFSVGRTQELVYALHRLTHAGRIPDLPVFVDSPLSANVTEIFRHHYECYDEETREVFLDGRDPFGFSTLKYVRAAEESKKLNHVDFPCVIISASGMCEAGRILHHLKNNIEDPNNLVLIVGFMAPNTLGRRLVEKKPRVRIFGEPYNLAAEVEVMNEFSAHADAADLEEFAREVAARGDLRRVFIVHGEKEQSLALKARLQGALEAEIIVPEAGRKYVIEGGPAEA